MACSSLRVVLAAFGILGFAADVLALSCADPETRVPVFGRQNADNGDVILTTDPLGGGPPHPGATIMFMAAPMKGPACPAGTGQILGLFNSGLSTHFYTANTNVSNAMTKDPAWVATPLKACIANSEPNPAATGGTPPFMDDLESQSCDVPLFRQFRPISEPPATLQTYHTSASQDKYCRDTAGCASAPIGRVYPPLVPYVARAYAEDYRPLSGLTFRSNPAHPFDPFPAGKTSLTDPVAKVQNIGFDFTFFGKTYRNINITANGIITFNGAASATADGKLHNVPLTDPKSVRNFVAGWGSANKLTNPHAVSVVLAGASPAPGETHGHRRLIVEWSASDGWEWIPSLAGKTITRSMQIHLIEDGNRIEIHYGPHKSGPGTDRVTDDVASIGIAAPFFADGNVSAGVSQLGYNLCNSNCIWKDPSDPAPAATNPNNVIAFMAQPSGFLVTESYALDDYVPLSAATSPTIVTDATKPVMITLPGWFEFDGQIFSQVGVSPAGFLTFGAAPPSIDGSKHPDILTSSIGLMDLKNTIAPWWADLTAVSPPPATGWLAYGAPTFDPGRFVIEWRGLVDKKTGSADPSRRNMQVQLVLNSNELIIQYGTAAPSGPLLSPLDKATVGVIGAEPNANGGPTGDMTYRLLNCTPNCSEATRDRTLSSRPNGTMGWPRGMRFVLTPDKEPRMDWHYMYRQVFMPTALAPKGVHSEGHCGDCHKTAFDSMAKTVIPETGLDVNEEKLYRRMFSPFAIPSPGYSPAGAYDDTCAATIVDPGENTWASLLMLDVSGALDRTNSQLVNPNGTPVTWLTEPAGGFYAGEPNMPWDAWCPAGKIPGLPQAVNDAMKSRIRNWIMRGAP